MLRLKTILAGVTLAVVLAAGQAHAATWLLTYTSTGGLPLVANLTLTASDVMNTVGGFDALSLSGAVDGDSITGLIANPSQPLAHYSADGMFIYDNVVCRPARRRSPTPACSSPAPRAPSTICSPTTRPPPSSIGPGAVSATWPIRWGR